MRRGDVRLDLGALAIVQRALRNLEEMQLVRCEVGRDGAVGSLVGESGNDRQLRGSRRVQHGGFVRVAHDLTNALELLQLGGERPIDIGGADPSTRFARSG